MSERQESAPTLEIELPNIQVMFVQAEDGPVGAQQAFQRLEKALGNLKGRRFYGTFHNGEYRANVALREIDNPQVYVFEAGQIPGGKYARKKIKGYEEDKLGEVLPKEFDALRKQYDGKVDPDRPSIEFYRSQKELIIMLPLI